MWVEYSREGVTGLFWEYKGGSKTVSCCAHNRSVILYLSFARLQNYTANPEIYTPSLCDTADVVFEIDSGEESQ